MKYIPMNRSKYGLKKKLTNNHCTLTVRMYKDKLPITNTLLCSLPYINGRQCPSISDF